MDIRVVQDGIVAEFSALGDWFDVYERLVALGRDMPPAGDDLRTEGNRIHGCQSQVWISAQLENGGLSYRAHSDSAITAGMIALLLRVLNRRTPAEIAGTDLHFVKAIGLTRNLSPTRADGLGLIIQRMKALAAEAS